MLLHKGLMHIHSQKKKPRLHFGESFTLKQMGKACIFCHNAGSSVSPLAVLRHAVCVFVLCFPLLARLLDEVLGVWLNP